MTALPPASSIDPSTRVTRVSTITGDRLPVIPPGRVRLSWRVESDDPAAVQRGYEISDVAEGDPVGLGPVDSSSSISVVAPRPLAPGEARRICVRVATSRGWTAWSNPLVVEAGVGADQLVGRVIGRETSPDGPVVLVRREFTLGQAPGRARLRLSALGLVDAWINGHRATDALLTPGWTAYQERVLVDTADVTPLLRAGTNVIVLAVGDGWYRGSFGFARRVGIYGTRSGAIAQVEVDGTVVVATDDTWSAGFGAVQAAGLYDGTDVDLRQEPPGLHEPGFHGAGWQDADIVETDLRRFEPRATPPVRVVETLAMTVTPRATGVLLDAGQNISGWVRVRVTGRAGDEVVVRHAEVLEPSGALHTSALRTARATDRYVLDRDGEHELSPTFTFHGFRYAEVSGAEVLSATAVAVSSDLPRRSRFRSSHPALDQFHENVFWSQRDNFVSVPTDCPQRDERLGWTGDAQAFAATACTLMDTEAFWLSWLRDLEIDQTDAGGVPSVVPDIIRREDMRMGGLDTDNMGRAGWADAATIVPFAVYESYGSTEVLERQLDSMRRWVAHLRRRAGDGIVLPTEPFQYGDWLDPDAPAARPWQAKVSSDYVANAFYVHSVRLLAYAERLVGDPDAGDDLDDLAGRVAALTWQRWGEEAVTTQTGAALALEFDIAPQDRHAAIADALAENVRREAGRIATGFLGTPLVLFALSRHGHLPEAYLMLLRREAPSWLYQVDRGATTVWERWDAIRPDGTIHSGAMDVGSDGNGSMLSFNHYAYGAMVDWVYRTVAGLVPAAPGYRRVRVAPRPCEGLDSAAAEIDTRLGRLAIDWTVGADQTFSADLEIPFGAEAELDLPVTATSEISVDGAGARDVLGHGRHRIVVTHALVTRVPEPD